MKIYKSAVQLRVVGFPLNEYLRLTVTATSGTTSDQNHIIIDWLRKLVVYHADCHSTVVFRKLTTYVCVKLINELSEIINQS